MEALGIDIGGTKIRAGVISAEGRLVCTAQVPTRALEGPGAVLEQVGTVGQQVLAQCSRSVCGVGVASAGRIDSHTGAVLFSTDAFKDWKGTPIKAELTRTFRLPVAVLNDVNAAAVGEQWLGAAQGLQRAVVVALGTGVGGALIEGGRVASGAHFAAGEIGHMAYRAGDRLCGCGHRGCFEPYVASAALAADYSRAVGRNCGGEEVLAAYRTGEPAARVAVEEWLRALATLLYSIQNGFDPERVILAGGIVDNAADYWPLLMEMLEAQSVRVDLHRAKLGSAASLYGAARLALNLCDPERRRAIHNREEKPAWLESYAVPRRVRRSRV